MADRARDNEPDEPEVHQTQVDIRESSALPAATLDAVAPGTRIGRYTILDIVGAGGVGVVYAAYDPDLDRKVALKQLRRSKLIGQTEAVNQRRTRLRREAQALARLSHPNVVPVYEVATFDDQIYVVMEFVEGSTFGDWLRAAPRGWSEVVGLFMQAGRGLAAAHAADIVHRDFKPDNVRVGDDGRVRVLDFGLAAPLRDVDPEFARVAMRSDSDDSSWSDSNPGASEQASAITREGQVMGTPAYMAPEQAAGGAVDARSDQFSFCVALYEALYGVRPFNGRFDNPRRFRDLSRAKALPGSRPPELPLEIERVLIRGLSLVPERRFASMDELLSELSSVARSSRRLFWVPLGTMLLALLTVIAFTMRRSQPRISCDDGTRMLAGVWDDAVATELGAAVDRSPKPYAAETWASAERNLDEWAEHWSRARVRACEATHVQADQSPELLERRIACLDLQLIRVEATITGLRRLVAQPELLLERLSTMSLPSFEGCAAANVLDHGALEPSEPERAREAERIRELLAQVEGVIGIGDYEQAIAQAEAALAQAEALNFEPVTAEAQLLLGIALHRHTGQHERAEAILRGAAWAGQRTGHDAVVVRASAMLAELLGTEAAKPELAATWAELARATFERHGGDPNLETEFRRPLAALAVEAGDFETALVDYRRALTLQREINGEHDPNTIATLRSIGDVLRELARYDESYETLTHARTLASEALGAKHPVVAQVLDALANVEASRGRFMAALELHTTALRINEEIFGPDHIQVARTLNNLAIIYDETGRYQESATTLERARTILVSHYGAEHPDVAFVDVNLGSALQNLDRNDEALSRYELALTNLERALGPSHMAVGVTLQNLGAVRSALGEHAGALEAFDRSQLVLEQAFGDSHPSIAALELNRAKSLRKLHRHDEALAAANRALVMREHIFGPAHTELVEVLVSLADTELALDMLDRAREHGERAMQLLADANTPREHAGARLLHAKLLLAGKPSIDDRARAEALAREALALVRTSEGGREQQADIEQWLVEHGLVP